MIKIKKQIFKALYMFGLLIFSMCLLIGTSSLAKFFDNNDLGFWEYVVFPFVVLLAWIGLVSFFRAFAILDDD